MEYSPLEQRQGESDFEHHSRIIEGKLGDKTLSDFDYSELSKYAYGKEYSTDVARRMFYGSKRTLDYLNSARISSVSDTNLLSEIDDKIVELQIAKQKFYDQRNAFNKAVRERSRQEELNEILINAVKNGELPRLNYEPTYVEPSSSDILVSLNDIHYGIEIANAWNTYNPKICKQMMCGYLNRILEITKIHHSENCIVYNCGDSISGRIRLSIQVANRENVINQVKGVSELISEFLAELSPYFKSIRYIGVAGNHSRLEASKDNCPHDERLDDLIEWYLTARLQNFENIFIINEKLDETMCMFDIRGKKYLSVHGDYETSDSKIQALQTMSGEPIYAVLLGHKHHNKIDNIQGIKTIMSGSFQGIDNFCIQKRIYGKPEQIVCICDDSGVVCYYDVQL